MTNNTEQQAVPVAQEDRELFIFLLGFDAVKDEASFDRIRAGEFDGWKKMQMIARHRLDATQTREAEGPRLMSDEAKTGERVLVHFTGKGWLTVTWEDPHGDGSYSIWTVDDDKHGPYALRGYREGDDTHWMPLPDAPRAALNARGGA